MSAPSKRVLILGATSAIAQAAARRWATTGNYSFCLIARDPVKLRAVAADLQVRGAKSVVEIVCDLDDCRGHSTVLDRAVQQLRGLDIALIAYGVLGDQLAAEKSYDAAAAVLQTNLISPISLLTWLANYFEPRKAGTIAIISSVAGDRGRGSNYIYGTSKAGINVMAQGIRNRLSASGVRVVTVKPGFVDTPMTAAIAKNAMFSTPEKVAKDICRSVEKGPEIVYTPWFWRWIMWIIRLIPERIFKRLNL